VRIFFVQNIPLFLSLPLVAPTGNATKLKRAILAQKICATANALGINASLIFATIKLYYFIITKNHPATPPSNLLNTIINFKKSKLKLY